MNLLEQYTTASNALCECMINHAVTIMKSWALEVDYDAYADRLYELEDGSQRLFESFLVEDSEEREEELVKLTAKAFRLLDELMAKVGAKRSYSFPKLPTIDELIDQIDWENQSQLLNVIGRLVIELVEKDDRIDFFPETQKHFEDAIGDGEYAFGMLCAIVENAPSSTVDMSDFGREHIDRMLNELPDTWLFETLVGEDEERYKKIALDYLKIGRMDLLWDEPERAEKWLVKRLRSGKASARDYMNFGHCCWLIRGDRTMAYENYRTARLMCKNAKDFFAIFRPDRHYLAEKEIPLEHIYLMEDQLLSIVEN